MVLDDVQAGLTRDAGSHRAVPPAAANAPRPRQVPTVYEDYFTVGTAPTEPCPMHGGGQNVPGVSGSLAPSATDADAVRPCQIRRAVSDVSNQAATQVQPRPQVRPSSQTISSNVERVVGTDGHVKWVIRQH